MTLSIAPKHDQTLKDPEIQKTYGKKNHKTFKGK